jgi:hypothetical protein
MPGGRSFDILVNGAKIASQTLHEDQPGRFFDAAYPIPASLIQGRDKITVRFQAHPGKMAGGLYGVRTMKRE